MKEVLLDNSGPINCPLWDPRTNRMEETNNRALQLLDRLMDRPRVNIVALKRVADIGDEEEYRSEKNSRAKELIRDQLVFKEVGG